MVSNEKERCLIVCFPCVEQFTNTFFIPTFQGSNYGEFGGLCHLLSSRRIGWIIIFFASFSGWSDDKKEKSDLHPRTITKVRFSTFSYKIE